jgi:hypothetical protein
MPAVVDTLAEGIGTLLGAVEGLMRDLGVGADDAFDAAVITLILAVVLLLRGLRALVRGRRRTPAERHGGQATWYIRRRSDDDDDGDGDGDGDGGNGGE